MLFYRILCPVPVKFGIRSKNPLNILLRVRFNLLKGIHLIISDFLNMFYYHIKI